jgi:hypothetical protein
LPYGSKKLHRKGLQKSTKNLAMPNRAQTSYGTPVRMAKQKLPRFHFRAEGGI